MIENADIQAATEAWSAAFNDHDANKIAALYDPDAILWGTLSPTIITSAHDVRAYFERAFAGNPPPRVTLEKTYVRRFGDIAVSSGNYTLEFWIDGMSNLLPARFSFTYRRAGDAWFIVDHHSSLLPPAPQVA